MLELTQDERVVLARMVMSILDRWGIAAADQVRLLGLPARTPPRTLKRFHDNTPLPDSPEVMERVEHLLGIATALRTTFPHNAHMDAQWMRRTNRYFPRRPPLKIILEDGLEGLIRVRSHLDCAYSWTRTGA